MLLKYRYKATGNNTTWKFKFEISKGDSVFAEIATSPELRDGLWHDAIVDINKLMPGWAAAKGNGWVLMIVAEPLHAGDRLSIDDVRFVADNEDAATAGTREDICRNIEIPLPHYYGYSVLTAAPDEARGEKPFQLLKIDHWEGTCKGEYEDDPLSPDLKSLTLTSTGAASWMGGGYRNLDSDPSVLGAAGAKIAFYARTTRQNAKWYVQLNNLTQSKKKRSAHHSRFRRLLA